MDPLLVVNNLRTFFFTEAGVVKAVDGASFQVDRGETIALVGESGCGKTVSALSIMRLIRRPGKIVSGEVYLDGKPLLEISEEEMRRIRGSVVSLIFQEPSASFDPIFTVGSQVVEAVRQHRKLNKKVAERRALEMFQMLNIPDASHRFDSYPFELSGGMLQRMMIASALSCDPALIIADEPTTSLDTTTQAQVLELIRRRTRETGTSLILITHNLGLVARYAKRVYIMYVGRIVEAASVDKIFRNPQHPYTLGLLACVPRLDRSKREGLTPLGGNAPTPLELGPGRPFSPRCKESTARCIEESPVPRSVGDEHFVSCHRRGRDVTGV